MGHSWSSHSLEFIDEKLFAFGGLDGDEEDDEATASVEAYVLQAQKWHACKSYASTLAVASSYLQT